MIAERFERYLKLIPGIQPSGRILLNPELLVTPVDCMDHVIIHELCRVKHPNHQRAFYRLLETVLPDRKRSKERLENCEI